MTRRSRVEMLDREFDPAIPGLPLDIATSHQLRARVGDEMLQRAGRVRFHVVIVCTAGEGLHEVDFTPVALEPGRVVHVRPGQVHRWRLGRDYDATVLFFTDEDSGDIRADGWPIGPRWFDLTDVEYERTLRLIDLASEERDLGRPSASRDRAMRGVLQLLLVNLGLDQNRHVDSARLPTPYQELMDQFETHRDWSRSVKKRAERLGYSARTLSRACHTAVGRTAKEVIDDRIMLEARRLLVNRDITVEAVARALSFSEPSNFSKFFVRMSGETPDRWRQRHLAGPGASR